MEKDQQVYDVIVIGGGASGMMTALVAAQNGCKVLLLEKNKRLGEKLRITGGGRCNITNAEEDIRIFLKNYQKAEQYLYSAFSQFDNIATMQLFESIKLPLKIEARKRVFPASEKASDVIHVLTNRMHRLGVDIRTKTTVSGFELLDTTIQAITTSQSAFSARSYVLATGGLSRPETGSTGDGFTWLEGLGHNVRTPTPSITPLAVKETWVSLVAGVTVKDVTITFFSNKKNAFKLKGDILFTHFGMSGPLLLNSAYRVGDLLENGEVTASVDLFPAIDSKALDQRCIAILDQNGPKLLKNVLPLLTPSGFAPALRVLCQDSIPLDAKCSEVSKASRQLLVTLLKNVPLTIDKLMGFERAVVADGGVSLNEVDTRTMRSKKITNLYITGDMLDINRPSGGYSLQLCWTSGYVAGTDAAKTR
jgi:predicted Rossmann fold flavoprotein